MTSSPTIVVADDEPMMRHLLKQTLEGQGFNVLLAEDGLEAFELVKKHPVQLLLSDINMPKCNGLKLLENLRLSDQRSLPVILMTGDTDQFVVSQSLGAIILRKPFRRRELVELIQTILPPVTK